MSAKPAQNSSTDHRLIHPDGVHPTSDFKGWIGQLVKEAREAGVAEGEIMDQLRIEAQRIEGDVEWVHCEGCHEEAPESDLEPVQAGGPRSCLEPVHLCPECRGN